MKTSGIHCFSVEQMSQKSGGFRRAQPPADAYPQPGSIGMARSYYSTIFEQSADEIWNVIRDFNNYPVWVDGAGESEIEAGKPGDAVGAVRNVLYQGKRIRQKLLAMSDVERSQTYEFSDAGTYRCKITGQPYDSCPSLTATEHSRSGGQRSIASLSAARSRLGSFVSRLPDGWARCGGSSMNKVPAARSPSPFRAA
jgi:hypothetical protein